MVVVVVLVALVVLMLLFMEKNRCVSRGHFGTFQTLVVGSIECAWGVVLIYLCTL